MRNMKKLFLLVALLTSYFIGSAQITNVNGLNIKSAAGIPINTSLGANGGILVANSTGGVTKSTVIAAIGSRARQVTALNDSTLQVICDSVTYTFKFRGNMTTARTTYVDSARNNLYMDTTYVKNIGSGTKLGYVAANKDTILLKTLVDSDIVATVYPDSTIHLGIKPSGVTPGTYGDATHSVIVQVGANGLVKAISVVAITGTGGGSAPKKTINTQNGTSYTLVQADTATYITTTSSSTVTISVPDDATAAMAPPVNLDLYQMGSGKLIITPLNGTVSIFSPNGRLKSAGQYSKLILNKLSTNTWVLSGNLDTTTVPFISTNVPSLGPFTATTGSASSALTFHIFGGNLTTNIGVTAPTNFEISKDNVTYSTGTTIAPVSGTVSDQLMYARIAASAAQGAVSGNIGLSSTGAQPQTVGLSGTVTSSPIITPSGSLSAFSTTAGTPSALQTFTFTAANLSANVGWAAGTGMEVSSNGTVFGPSATFAQSGGSASGTVSVRIASATTAGTYNANIAGNSTGATTANVPYSATVTSSTTDDTVNVNLYDASGGVGQIVNSHYNNINIGSGSTTNQTTAVLNYATGSASPFTVTYTANNTLTNMFYVDNGSSYAAGTTNSYGYPQGVFRVALTYNDDGPDSVIINNVPTANHNYSIIIPSSRATATARPQTFVCNGTTITGFDAANNINNLIRFDNIAPVGGKIIIIMTSPSQTSGNRFTYTNGFTLIKHNN